MTAKKTLEAFYRSVAGADVPAMLELLDENVAWTEAAGFPYAGTYHGRQEILEGVFTRVAADWDTFDTEPEQLVADGDDVVAVGTYRGTCTATGRSFSARFAHAVTVKDGRIVRFEQVVDTARINEAMR